MQNRKPVQISSEAHQAAKQLAEMMRKEQGVVRVSLQDAASLAILEALRRRQDVQAAPAKSKAA
jgi:hypothetical protein